MSTKIQWLTTGSVSADSPRGWRLHAVRAEDQETSKGIRCRSAECGMIPAHGWDLDLFIEKKCVRCLRATGLVCPTCKGRGDMGKPNYMPCYDCNFTGERKS